MIYGPLEHYDYSVVTVECECHFCTDWRAKRTVFERWKRLTKGHGRSCYCWRCCNRRESHTSFAAADNKRDVYCELSWYAAQNNKYGPRLMSWMEKVLKTETMGDGWWSTRAPYYPPYHFLHRFQITHQATIPAVSGMFLEHLGA